MTVGGYVASLYKENTSKVPFSVSNVLFTAMATLQQNICLGIMAAFQVSFGETQGGGAISLLYYTRAQPGIPTSWLS